MLGGNWFPMQMRQLCLFSDKTPESLTLFSLVWSSLSWMVCSRCWLVNAMATYRKLTARNIMWLFDRDARDFVPNYNIFLLAVIAWHQKRLLDTVLFKQKQGHQQLITLQQRKHSTKCHLFIVNFNFIWRHRRQSSWEKLRQP